MAHVHTDKTVKVINKAAPAGFVYFLTIIGAAVYFIQQTSGGFFEVIFAILQALVWPAFVVYQVLQMFAV